MADIFFGLHCPDCGEGIEESDKHCPHCGTNLDAPLEKDELEALARQYFDKAQKNLDRSFISWALADCDRALEYMPDMAAAHNLRGLILDEMGRPAEALLEYQGAVRLNPGDTDAIANLEDAQAEYQHRSQKKSVNRNKGVKLNFRLLFIVTGIGFAVQAVCFVILVLSNGEPGDWYRLFSNLDVLGPALIYPFLADREERIKVSSGVIAGVGIAAPLSILETFLGIIYFLFFLPPDVLDVTDLQNIFYQSHPAVRLGYLMGLLIALAAVVMIRNGAIGAIGGALSSLVVTTKNKRKESLDGHENDW